MREQIIRKFRNYSGKFELKDASLRQSLDADGGGFTWREATRNSLRHFFRTLAITKRKNYAFTASGMYEGHTSPCKLWTVRMASDGKRLMIGCVSFTPLQTKMIQKWALATPGLAHGRRRVSR